MFGWKVEPQVQTMSGSVIEAQTSWMPWEAQVLYQGSGEVTTKLLGVMKGVCLEGMEAEQALALQELERDRAAATARRSEPVTLDERLRRLGISVRWRALR
jgi:hypothetical protein